MSEIKPRGVVDGKKFEGKKSQGRTYKEMEEEQKFLNSRTKGNLDEYGLSWTLPFSASTILSQAFLEAKEYPVGSFKRAQIIDQAIRRVRRDYPKFFKYDPGFCICK